MIFTGRTTKQAPASPAQEAFDAAAKAEAEALMTGDGEAIKQARDARRVAAEGISRDEPCGWCGSTASRDEHPRGTCPARP